MTVYLTGAGCGGPRWITEEARERISLAEHLVYDRLIHPDLLQLAPKTCRFHYVGKRKDSHSTSQDDICRLLVDLGRTSNRVVRLKGGDPFVFGRGGEEALALQKEGIPWSYVPGVTAAVSGLGAAGVPLTHRGVAETATLVTGHRGKDLSEEDDRLWQRMVEAGGTRAIYMGASRADSIAEKLMKEGEPGKRSCSAVRWGGWGRQERTDFRLDDMGNIGLRSPTVIAIGESSALGLTPVSGPLKGLQIGVVRPAPESWETARILENLGADCYSLPLVNLRKLEKNWDEEAIGNSDWLVLTSPRGASLLPEVTDLRKIGGRIISIGPGTSKALYDIGVHPDLEAEVPTSEGLADTVEKHVSYGQSILFFRNERASDLPVQAARGVGATVLISSAYRMERAELPGEEIYPLCWDESGLDCVVFGSAAMVEAWAARFGRSREGIIPVAWGTHCAEAIRETLSMEPEVMGDPSIEGLIECLTSLQRRKE